MFRRRNIAVLLCVANLTTLGCATTADHGRIADIKHAYLVKNEFLVVCLDGEVLGERGEFYVELPMNGTLLHPKHADRYFAPISRHVFLPQFVIPPSLMQRKCIPDEVDADRISVPIVRDVTISEPVIDDDIGSLSHAEKERYLNRLHAASISYIDSLKATDSKTGTVYSVQKSDGERLPNFIYASDRTLYGSYKAVSFVLPPREVALAPDSVLPIVLFPVALLAVSGMAAGYAVDAGIHKSSTVQEQAKPEIPPPIVEPVWVDSEGKLDPLLAGRWRSIEGVVHHGKTGTFIREDKVCTLEIDGNRMDSECSSEYGAGPHEAWVYRVVEPGKYEFQVIEDSSPISKSIGLRGMADYRLEDNRLSITSQIEGTYGLKVKTISYVPDRPRLSP